MNYTISLSSKGQIVLPVSVRKKLVQSGDTTLRLHYDSESNSVSIRPTLSLSALSHDLTKAVKAKKIKPLTDPSSYYNNRPSI